MRAVALLAVLFLAGCAEPEETVLVVANQAGCDGIGGSCTARGACCDTHDDCIDQNCPPGMGNVTACNQEARMNGTCPAACAACHDAVNTCVVGCTFNPNGAGCGPSTCCGDADDPEDDTCGEEQACYDRSVMPPELITDPCECRDRDIDLSPSPPRPEDHCCDETGWGCCGGEGEAPGEGGGGCCEGLEVGDDGNCKKPDPTETDP